MDEPLLFSSHRLKELVKQLYMQIASDRSSIFEQPLIVISHPVVKEWIQLECTRLSENQALLGWEFSGWQRALSLLTGSLPVPTKTDLQAALWDLSKTSPPKEWTPFLGSERKRYDLVEQCASLFSDYSLYGMPQQSGENWQIEVFQKIFRKHSWQTLADALESAAIWRNGPVYLFGLDWIPPVVYRFFQRHPRLRIFRFSPTAMFWEDVRSAREQKGFLAHARKKQIAQANLEALEQLMRQEHPLIANWGVLGRKTLEMMGDLEPLENYDLLKEPSTLLEQLQSELLTMEIVKKTSDDSIRIIAASASRLREVELLRDEMIRSASEGILYSEMRVYAPDIRPYAPLIEFVFSSQIPFRITGLDLARQSSYFQALEKLCKGVSGRWEASEWAALLDTKAFHERQGWQRDDVDQIKEWFAQGIIRWGVDYSHQKEIALQTIDARPSGHGTWEEGFDRLIDSWIFFDPEKERSLNWSDADLFQSFHTLFTQLKQTLFSWKAERTLVDWASEIEQLLADYLAFDEKSDEDLAAKNLIGAALSSLRDAGREVPEALFPFSFVQRHLFSDSKSERNGSQLHAVRFHSLEPGAVLPARALFLLGMDEESFPRTSAPSSLHLLKKEGIYLPQSGDLDRYLFLQAIFCAEEKLTLIYRRQSQKDGKAVSPSLLVQELFSYLNEAKPTPITPPSLAIDPRAFPQNPSLCDYRAALCALKQSPGSLLSSPLQFPATDGEKIISIRTLRQWLKHPFEFYLKQVVGLSFQDEVESKWSEFETSSLVRHLFLTETLHESVESVLEKFKRQKKFPPGLIGEEMQRHFIERAREMRDRLEEWNIDPSSIQSLQFKESSEPLIIDVNGTPIQLIGEAPLSVPNGVLHLGENSIKGVLKNWPELLCALAANNTTQIYPLRGGKERIVANVKLALHDLLALYLQYGQSPLFLHPDWADSMLRKNEPIELDSEDRILQWTLKRSPALDLPFEQSHWSLLLQKALAPLIDAFKRGSDADL